MKQLKEKHIRSLLTTCLLTFLPYFVSSGDAECQYPTSRINMVLTDETLLKNDFPEGSEATLRCAKGYVREGGSGTATCTAGQWSEIDLICKEKDCGRMEEMPHMSYRYDKGTLFGAQAYVSCDEGYDIIGPSYIQCYASGWTALPTCEVVTCMEPPQIENGKIVSTSYDKAPEYGDVVRYSCDDGYALVGNGSLVCTEEGEYSSSPPQCIEATIVTREGDSHTEPPSKTTMRAAPTDTPSTPEGGGEQIVTDSPNSSAIPTSTKGTTRGPNLLVFQEKALRSITEPPDPLTVGVTRSGPDEGQQDGNKVFYLILIGGLVAGGAIVICFIMGMIHYHSKKGNIYPI